MDKKETKKDCVEEIKKLKPKKKKNPLLTPIHAQTYAEETNICVYLALIVFPKNSLENNFYIHPKTQIIHIF